MSFELDVLLGFPPRLFHSWAIVQILRHYVDRVVVADPAQLKAIANARIKTDKVDAHILAQLLRMDFLPEIELPAAETWAVRQLMAHRNQLRRQSVATKNTIHAVLNRSLLRYPGSFLFTEKGFRWLAELVLPPAERMVLDHQTTLLREVQARFAPLLRFLLSTGARRSEALGLQWRDVDLERGRITIRRALTKGLRSSPCAAAGDLTRQVTDLVSWS